MDPKSGVEGLLTCVSLRSDRQPLVDRTGGFGSPTCPAKTSMVVGRGVFLRLTGKLQIIFLLVLGLCWPQCGLGVVGFMCCLARAGHSAAPGFTAPMGTEPNTHRRYQYPSCLGNSQRYSCHDKGCRALG